MNRSVVVVIASSVILASCGLEGTMGAGSSLAINGEGSAGAALYEERMYETGPQGEEVVRIVPRINSYDDLIAYREMKHDEAKRILNSTRDRSGDRPYYPVVITMKKPVPLQTFRAMLGEYNPSVAKALTEEGSIKYLPKGALVVDKDTLLADFIKFNSTVGHGRLAYETLTSDGEILKLERQIAAKQRELNGVGDYQLVKGVISVTGGIHRDTVVKMQGDPRVFLADIGPPELYEDTVQGALWEDIYALVEQYDAN